jgi:uncharacterized protein YkwD
MASRAAWTGVYLILCSVLVVGAAVAVVDTDAEPEPAGAELNTTAIEQAVHTTVNRERAARGLATYEYRPDAAAAAENHAAWMVETGRLEHTPDRYTCGPGANIAYTYAYGDIETGWGEIANHHGNETKIGQYLVKQWLHSPPHREHLLSQEYAGEGIGVAAGEVNGSVRVYAAQAFCTG